LHLGVTLVADPLMPTSVDSRAFASSTDAGLFEALLVALLETVARPVVPVPASGSSITRVAVFGSGGGSGVCTWCVAHADEIPAAVATSNAASR
jgi:hypothetical protein